MLAWMVRELHTSFLYVLTEAISSERNIDGSIGSENVECRFCLPLDDRFSDSKYPSGVLVRLASQLEVLPNCNNGFASGEEAFEPAEVQRGCGEA